MTTSASTTFSPSSLQHDPQHAVRGRVLRPHVDDEFVGVEHRAGDVRFHLLDLRFVERLAQLQPLLRALQHQLARALERVVLALRVPLPLVRHQDPPQVRMAGEPDPEHVERLALEPVGGRPRRPRPTARRRRRPRGSSSGRARAGVVEYRQ